MQVPFEECKGICKDIGQVLVTVVLNYKEFAAYYVLRDQVVRHSIDNFDITHGAKWIVFRNKILIIVNSRNSDINEYRCYNI